MEDFGYGFMCPLHGLEIQAFCFRAFQEENISKWKKLSLFTQEPESIEELQIVIKKLMGEYSSTLQPERDSCLSEIT